MSHMHKSTKMRFPGNQPEILQLHKNITSSKMVVRGWYMTHFDPRDLLNSKNRFGVVSATYPTSAGRFAIFLDFFGNFDLGLGFSKSDFFDFRVRKKCSKINFFKIFGFPKNYNISAPEWYIYIGHTPSGSRVLFF